MTGGLTESRGQRLMECRHTGNILLSEGDSNSQENC